MFFGSLLCSAVNTIRSLRFVKNSRPARRQVRGTSLLLRLLCVRLLQSWFVYCWFVVCFSVAYCVVRLAKILLERYAS